MEGIALWRPYLFRKAGGSVNKHNWHDCPKIRKTFTGFAVRKPFFFQAAKIFLLFCYVLLFGAREGRVDGNLNLSEPRQLLGVNLQFSLHGR